MAMHFARAPSETTDVRLYGNLCSCTVPTRNQRNRKRRAIREAEGHARRRCEQREGERDNEGRNRTRHAKARKGKGARRHTKMEETRRNAKGGRPGAAKLARGGEAGSADDDGRETEDRVAREKSCPSVRSDRPKDFIRGRVCQVSCVAFKLHRCYLAATLAATLAARYPCARRHSPRHPRRGVGMALPNSANPVPH
jgi:hypothetical protein